MKRVDRLLALVAGLALAGAGAVVAIETILLAAGQPSLVVPRARWARDLSTLTWSDTTLDVLGGVIAGVGLVVWVAQLVPRRPVRVLVDAGGGAPVWMSRRSMIRRVNYDIGRVAEVDRATVRITRRAIRVRARMAPGVTAAAGHDVVARAAGALVALIPPARPLRIRVRIRVAATPPAATTLSVGPPSGAASGVSAP